MARPTSTFAVALTVGRQSVDGGAQSGDQCRRRAGAPSRGRRRGRRAHRSAPRACSAIAVVAAVSCSPQTIATGSPFDADRVERVGVVLVDRLHQHLTHHALGRVVVGRAALAALPLHAVVGDEVPLVEEPQRAEAERRLGSGGLRPQQRYAGQHDPAHQLGTRRGELHRDPAAERVADEDRPRSPELSLVEALAHPLGVLRRAPAGLRRRRGAEAGQVERERVVPLRAWRSSPAGCGPSRAARRPWPGSRRTARRTRARPATSSAQPRD